MPAKGWRCHTYWRTPDILAAPGKPVSPDVLAKGIILPISVVEKGFICSGCTKKLLGNSQKVSLPVRIKASQKHDPNRRLP